MTATNQVGWWVKVNGSSQYRHIAPGEVEVIARRNHKDAGTRFVVRLDDVCVVQPINPTTIKNRGRLCAVRYLRGTKATVQFFDDGSLLRIPLDDIVPQNGTVTHLTTVDPKPTGFSVVKSYRNRRHG